ncbi:hypothetical protein [Microbispora sp. NPDC049125]|uniref:hypothetical protein n=1 Tax=Microbispora sp. NPDC049125 TaxID=3154929 RepID=UPI0034656CC4
MDEAVGDDGNMVEFWLIQATMTVISAVIIVAAPEIAAAITVVRCPAFRFPGTLSSLSLSIWAK